ncbi:MAG TPA: hypothetical protein VME63_04555 [Dyella sp.]|uniref:hypothetical protein n=1 Tax=Dyella sp. TaxID=1869338 RepID=UPI002B7C320A|nr:hypothetical protein [Dyella sp.]HTV84650.1 hypothetical protein [Dyella sp.]
MSTSIYDFDTQCAPFEALGSLAPFAPFACFAWLSAPVYGWLETWANTYGLLTDAMVSAMTYPFELSAPSAAFPPDDGRSARARPHAPGHVESGIGGHDLRAS